MVSQLESSTRDPQHRLPYSVEGLVQVFTSAHRSFFSNVMAQSLQLAGQGMPVLVAQFLKGGIAQGHEHPVQLGQNLHWLRCNLPRCINSSDVDESEKAIVQDLWHYTRKVVARGDYSLVVLDELSLAIKFGLISEAEVLDFLQTRPRQVDVILTGPEMPQALLDIADQITELRRSHRP